MATILTPRLLLALVIVLLCLVAPTYEIAALAQEPKEWSSEFYHDFRGRPLPAELSWFNAEGGKFFRAEPEGLRIVIPDTWTHPWGGIGFRTSFGFNGNFEVTTAFEILRADIPPKGYGVGLCLYLAMGPEGASLCRLTRSSGREVLLWDRAQAVPGKKNPRVIEKTIPCDAKSVRLRFQRTGSILHYLWAPGTEGGAFEEVHQVEIGDGPVERVRLAGVTGREAANLDVRLLDLRIRSGTSDRPEPAPVETPQRSWRLAGVSGLILAMLVVTWLAVRRNRREVRE